MLNLHYMSALYATASLGSIFSFTFETSGTCNIQDIYVGPKQIFKQLIIMTVLYSGELWIQNFKKLQAALHKFRVIIEWKNKKQNKVVSVKNKNGKDDLIIEQKRSRWLGYVLHMKDDSILKQLCICK